jgi:hypothetical protein
MEIAPARRILREKRPLEEADLHCSRLALLQYLCASATFSVHARQARRTW